MSYEIPEWVFVWTWARWSRSPRCFAPFPQENSPQSMSDDEYAELRAEWIAAGSPHRNPIEAMSEGSIPRTVDLDRVVSTLQETA